GNIASISPAINNLNLRTINPLSYTSGRTWANNMEEVTIGAPSVITTSQLDNLLIDLANVTTWAGLKKITVEAASAYRSAASDAAVATLVGKGVTVVVNKA